MGQLEGGKEGVGGSVLGQRGGGARAGVRVGEVVLLTWTCCFAGFPLRGP